jgi:hypothetical protein
VENFGRVKKKSLLSEQVEAEYDLTIKNNFDGILNTGTITDLRFEDKQYNYKLKLTKSNMISCKISGAQIGIGSFAKCYALHVGKEANYVAKFLDLLLPSLKNYCQK